MIDQSLRLATAQRRLRDLTQLEESTGWHRHFLPHVRELLAHHRSELGRPRNTDRSEHVHACLVLEHLLAYVPTAQDAAKAEIDEIIGLRDADGAEILADDE